jgi:membrane protein required for colicin V production
MKNFTLFFPLFFLSLHPAKLLDMNKLDMILLLPIGMGFIFGLFKGLIKEITSLAAIVLGIYGAKLLAPFVSHLLISSFHFSEKTAMPMSYLVLFAGIAIGLLILAKSLEKVFDSLALGGLNKLFGGIFGALKYALIVSVLLIVFNAIDSHFPIMSSETKENSIAYKPLMKLAPTLWDEAKKEHQSKQKISDEKVEDYSK